MNPRRLLRLLLPATLLLTACDQSPADRVESLAKTLYRYNPSKAAHRQFSGEKALAHVQALVDFGPRPSGSAALEKSRGYIETELKRLGWETKRQSFKDYTPKGEIEFHNILARLPVSGSDTWGRTAAVLIGSHYDTKLFSSIQFVGANDAGSSTGALLEMARVIAPLPDLAQFIELVFFDGEEAIVDYTMNGNLPDDGLYGSRYYVQQLRKLPPEKHPGFLILLDMVGEKDLRIEMPSDCDPDLVRTIIAAGDELGYRKHFARAKGAILDDYTPFLVSTKVRCVDLIDIDYAAWHTAGDTMDKISAESIEIASKTALLAIEKYLLGAAGNL